MKSTEVKVLSKRILIKLDEAEETTQGGVIIPDSSQEKTPIGVVVKIGEKITEVKLGEKVLFNEGKPIKAFEDKGDFFVIREKDILSFV